MIPTPATAPRWRRVVDRLLAARVVSSDSRFGRWVGLGASGIVLVGCVVSVRALDLTLGSLRPAPLVALIVVSCGLILLNAIEYRLTSRITGGEATLRAALHVTVLASAANVLPLPAGAMIRIQGLREGGASTRRAATASIAVALFWIAVAGTFAAVGVAVRGRWEVAAATVAFSVVVATIASKLIRSYAPSARLVATVVLTEVGFVVNAAIRFQLVLMAIDVDVAWTQAVVLAASSSLASAVGIVPGAFGVAEGLGAVLAAAVALPASAGFLATALLRLTSVVLIGGAGLALTIRRPAPPTS